jgi:hypothetical protein
VCGEPALLTLQSPQAAALDEARRDGVQLAPALEAVGLDDSFKRIVHFSSFSLLARRGQAASDGYTCWLFRRIGLLARKSSRGPLSTRTSLRLAISSC